MNVDLKFGLIGAGAWGRNIIRTLIGIPGVQLTHIATRTRRLIQEIPPSCIISNNWRCLVTDNDLDGLLIATPAGLHAEMSDFALKRKIPTFVEKPIALTVADAQILRDTVEKYSGILQVNYIDIANPAWQALKKKLFLVGKIEKIEATFGGAGPVRSDITPLWDWGSHPIALILSLLKEPDSIRARQIYKKHTGNGNIEDIKIFFNYKFAEAQISISNNYSESIRRLSIIGTTGMLVYEDNSIDKLVFIKGGKVQSFVHSNKSPLRSALDRFINSIVDGSPDFKDAILGVLVTKTLSNIDSLLH